jgi:hypothetical protein
MLRIYDWIEFGDRCWNWKVEVGGCMFRRSVVIIAISGKMPSPAELERVCLALIGAAQTLLDRSN